MSEPWSWGNDSWSKCTKKVPFKCPQEFVARKKPKNVPGKYILLEFLKFACTKKREGLQKYSVGNLFEILDWRRDNGVKSTGMSPIRHPY